MADAPKPGADPHGEMTEFERAISDAFDSPLPNSQQSEENPDPTSGQSIEELTAEFEGDTDTDETAAADTDADIEPSDDSDEDQDGEEVEGEDEDTPTSESPPSTYNWRGVEYQASDVDVALETAQWLSQRGPEFIDAIGLLASGEYVLTPRDQGQAPPSSAPAPAREEIPEEDIIDPAAHKRIAELEQDYARLREQENQRVQYEAQQTLQQRLAVANVGKERWVDAHSSLKQDEIDNLERDLANLGILPGLIQAKGGDIASAMEAGLEQVYWSTPKYRELELNKKLESERADAQETTKRRRKASSLSGSGGSTSRTPPVANTKESRLEAMAAELGAHMNNGGQAS